MSVIGSILAKVTGNAVSEIAGKIGSGVGSVMDRIGFTPKMSEEQKIDKFVQVLCLDEKSTSDARQMFMTELQTQKQSWLIRFLNGVIRPLGGLGSLLVEFYAIVGANLSLWLKVEYVPIILTMEQHAFLLTIVCFYFGSRSREIIKGVSTQR